ncbi:trypsin [Trichuris suis]|nr:trypsin [Trichuris suis]
MVNLFQSKHVKKNKRYYDRWESDIKVLLEAHNVDVFEPERKVLSVDKFTHGGYDDETKTGDIALLHLGQPVTFTDKIKPVCLPKPNKGPPRGIPCYISGWGRTVSDGSHSSMLRLVDVKILKKKKCNLDGEAKTKSLCAGDMKGRKDACQGDSGGPLVCIVNDRFVLYGITSYGVGCGQPGQPGIYSEVARYIDWIKEQTAVYGIAFDPYKH